MQFPDSGHERLRTDSRSIDAVSLKGGAIFVVLSTDAVSLWHSESLTQLHCTRRVTASLESTGFNRRIYSRDDDKLVVVQTAGNVLLIYDLCEDLDPNARLLKSTNALGLPRIWLMHRQNIRVEASVHAVSVTEARLVMSTKRPAMIQTLYWDRSDGHVETDSDPIATIEFLKKSRTTRSSPRVVEMVFATRFKTWLWIDGSGNAYLVQYHSKQWTGSLLYEVDAPGRETVAAVFNENYAWVTISLASGEIRTFRLHFTENRAEGHFLHTYIAAPAIGSIRSLNYSPDGTTILLCGELGWAVHSALGYSIYTSCVASRAIEQHRSGEATSQASYLKLRCSIWFLDGYRVALFPIDEDVIHVEHFYVASGSNMLHPKRLETCYNNHLSDGKHPHDGFKQSLWSTILLPTNIIPITPLRFVANSPCGRFLAVGGRHGLAHFSFASGIWKSHRSFSDLMDNSLVAEPAWYHHYLVIAVLTRSETFQIRLLSREFDLEDILGSITLASKPLCLTIKDGQIYTVTDDHQIVRSQIMRTKEGRIVLEHMSDLPLHDVCLLEVPASARSIAVLHESTDSDAHLLILKGDVLWLYKPQNTTSEKSSCLKLAEKIEWFQLADGNSRLRNTLFAFDGHHLSMWFNILALVDLSRELPSASLVLDFDFIPFYVSWDAGVIEGLGFGGMKADAGAPARYKRHRNRSFVPDILEALLRHNLIGEAFVTSARFTNHPQFSYYLEVLLYRALEDAVRGHEALMSTTWNLLEKYIDLIPAILVACARKSEVSTWEVLFRFSGPPMHFFQESLAQEDLKTAGAYLIILLTFDADFEHQRHTLDLIKRAIKLEFWDLAIELTRFYSVVNESKQVTSEDVRKFVYDT